AGLLSAFVSVLQVFFQNWIDGTIFAHSHVLGRATGNMRQPNHLAYLLLWSVVAVAVLVDFGALRRPWAISIMFALMFALVLSASRTGLLCLTLLIAWTYFDRSLGRKSRSVVLVPIIFVTTWFLAAVLAGNAGLELGAQTRLVEGAGSPSRWLFLHDTL
ncbi:pilin glycosylation ligase domain-containing protein, partial [Roseateles sp. GG27B]